MAFSIGDLFAGAGLFSEGFRQAGFLPRFAVELDAEAVKSYRRNVGPNAVHGSVTDVLNLGTVDVLIAGPPCQGFSTLGRRDPLDARNDLCFAVLPWADGAKPKVIVIENVPPFLKSGHWQRLARGLRRRGYKIFTWELEAADFGTPQLRRRAFTIASKIGIISPPAPVSERISCAHALLNEPIAENDLMHRWPTLQGVSAQRVALVPANGDKRDIQKAAPELCPPSWQRIGCQATDVWGRIDPDEPANTLRCTFLNPSKGRYLHPTENRTISLREGARLQGIPDDWLIDGRPYQVARQIGNGVPIPLARAVAKQIYAALSAFETADSLAA
ncbi:DNA cytosine methyltransferase [Mesorhizobium sp. B2-3-5]|uniref:DNA cytosine methyltransferase n=1 Tax=Mesorhizobium sp. B2-3-5 TaxID=2589958 RepID=UPI0015E37425|nr:DNA cytosine methyltransferase [Mesorhizobium sp. B2-3-5]